MMKPFRLAGAVLVLVCLLTGAAQAHEVRPAYLEMRELDAQTYDVLWKVPARGDRRMPIYVRFPDHCDGTDPSSRFAGGGYIERWRTTCEDELVGHTVVIDGLSDTRTDVLARVLRVDGTTQTVRLTPDAAEFTLSAKTGTWDVVKTYFGLGVEHILLGIDHLLFVLALLFLVGGWRRLIGTVTAFTVAHSLTLAAATLGWVRVPQAPVEAVIALSILFVAVEIIHSQQGHPGLAEQKPWIVAFVFGLLHGLGFAGALRDVGLPEHAIPLALAFFNIGVEAGQLLFIAAVFGLLWVVKWVEGRVQAGSGRSTWEIAKVVSTPAAYLVGSLAAFWLLQRTYGFLT